MKNQRLFLILAFIFALAATMSARANGLALGIIGTGQTGDQSVVQHLQVSWSHTPLFATVGPAHSKDKNDDDQTPSSVPDRGATFILLGLGFLGMAALNRRLSRKQAA